MGRKLARRMNRFAAKLEQNLPQSEVWFRKFWESNDLKDQHDQYNAPWCKIIPDLVNHKFKYVIEIDGKQHNRPEQQRIDSKKDRFYASKKYQVLRVRAYKNEQLAGVAEVIERIRSGRDAIDVPVKQEETKGLN